MKATVNVETHTHKNHFNPFHVNFWISVLFLNFDTMDVAVILPMFVSTFIIMALVFHFFCFGTNFLSVIWNSANNKWLFSSITIARVFTPRLTHSLVSLLICDERQCDDAICFLNSLARVHRMKNVWHWVWNFEYFWWKVHRPKSSRHHGCVHEIQFIDHFTRAKN